MKLRRSLAACAIAVSAVLGGTMVLATPASAAPAYNAGQFCPHADEGKVITSDNGKQIQCRNVDGYYRWVIK